MKDARLEALLLGARPRTGGEYSDLTQAVMSQIRRNRIFSRQMNVKQPKRGLFRKLRTLHGGGLVVAIFVAFILLSGVAYASVRFIPDLIEVIDKKLNTSGHLEYSVPAFANCYTLGQPKLDTFEVAPTAGLSDEDVEKTLRAKCELMGMDKFANDIWPTYGENKEWKRGDTIFYARPDRLGKVKAITEHSLILEYSSGEKPTEYETFENRELEVYSKGERVALDALRPGDLVFSMVRVSEIYGAGRSWESDGVQFAQPADAQPRVRGVVGAVKLTLPERYYYEMQQYVHQVRPCEGNPGERCSDGPRGAGIDIFPREGGEGARNPYAPGGEAAASRTGRTITGTISVIRSDEFTIISGKGTKYIVRAPRSIIDTYNTTYAPHYTPYDVQAGKGSWVSLSYSQDPKADRKVIRMEDIVRLMLLTDISPKGGKL